jgi:hypothetical protein
MLLESSLCNTYQITSDKVHICVGSRYVSSSDRIPFTEARQGRRVLDVKASYHHERPYYFPVSFPGRCSDCLTPAEPWELLSWRTEMTPTGDPRAGRCGRASLVNEWWLETRRDMCPAVTFEGAVFPGHSFVSIIPEVRGAGERRDQGSKSSSKPVAFCEQCP